MKNNDIGWTVLCESYLNFKNNYDWDVPGEILKTAHKRSFPCQVYFSIVESPDALSVVLKLIP